MNCWNYWNYCSKLLTVNTLKTLRAFSNFCNNSGITDYYCLFTGYLGLTTVTVISNLILRLEVPVWSVFWVPAAVWLLLVPPCHWFCCCLFWPCFWIFFSLLIGWGESLRFFTILIASRDIFFSWSVDFAPDWPLFTSRSYLTLAFFFIFYWLAACMSLVWSI